MVPKIVLDTNVFVSALGWEGKPRRILRYCIDGRCHLFISQFIIHETVKVLSYPKFNFTRSQVDEFLVLIAEMATFVEPGFTLNIISTDPSDNRILECALAAECRYIVTGDKHLLDLENFPNIQIVTPDTFLSTGWNADR